ncbi:hypothetical protein SVIO_042960 [Streptomyces violaceusniger]|uniref:Uncharacterized protein n=1 Tax=Streptomyces violaceusniger TaxID=68280 RepID=A0A4D4L6P2_STRVO|nr:hypothetical protein SVIO_042960 [Streptomyces violaceusniger]
MLLLRGAGVLLLGGTGVLLLWRLVPRPLLLGRGVPLVPVRLGRGRRGLGVAVAVLRGLGRAVARGALLRGAVRGRARVRCAPCGGGSVQSLSPPKPGADRRPASGARPAAPRARAAVDRAAAAARNRPAAGRTETGCGSGS